MDNGPRRNRVWVAYARLGRLHHRAVELERALTHREVSAERFGCPALSLLTTYRKLRILFL
jgi:hypothetical protein